MMRKYILVLILLVLVASIAVADSQMSKMIQVAEYDQFAHRVNHNTYVSITMYGYKVVSVTPITSTEIDTKDNVPVTFTKYILVVYERDK